MPVPVQNCMPQRRSGHTTAVTIGGERVLFTANGREDGSLGEVFVRWGKQGSAYAGLMDAYAVALSVGLQYGVPLASLLRPALGLYFVPAGHTDDPEIPRVRSIMDYVARRLAVDWLPYDERAALGVFTISELVEQTRADRCRLPVRDTQRSRQHSASSAVPESGRRWLRELAASTGAA